MKYDKSYLILLIMEIWMIFVILWIENYWILYLKVGIKKIEEMCIYMYLNVGINWFKLDRLWFCIVSVYVVFYFY